MKITNLALGRVSTVEVVPAIGSDFGDAVAGGQEVTLGFPDVTSDAVLRAGDKAWPVAGADDTQAATLARVRDGNLPQVVWVAASRPKAPPTETVLLQVHEFPSDLRLLGAIDIGVDEKIVDEVGRRVRRAMTVSEVTAWLDERMTLRSPDGETRVFFTGVPTVGAERRAFRLLGVNYAIDVAADSDGRLQVIRVVSSRRETSDRRPVELLHADVRFRDATIAGAFRGEARTELDQLVQQAGSYLGVWRSYNARERESIRRRAMELGVLRYTDRFEQADGKWSFRISGDVDHANEVLRGAEDVVELEASEGIPRELRSDGDPAFGQQSARLASPGRPTRFVGSFAGADPVRRTVHLRSRLDDDSFSPPQRGVLHLSLAGDRTRLDRRDDALASVVGADCSMPQLGLLLENRRVPARRATSAEPLSAAARSRFGGAPTPRQVEALRVALNTPDIALIQGPPGTGKTRTIAALEARLAELKQEGDPYGQTLLTSYQHDAVENAAARTIVFGLPARKVGRRSGSADEEDNIDRWRRDRVEAVRSTLANEPEQPVGEALRRVREVAAAYVSSPLADGESLRVAKEVEDVAGPFLPARLGDRLLAVRQELTNVRTGSSDQDGGRREATLKAVRAIRTDPTTFGDDGPMNALRALRRLEHLDLIEDDEKQSLEQAASWMGVDTPPFLDELVTTRAALIDRLSAGPRTASPAVHGDLEGLLGEIVDELYRQSRESRGGEAAALFEYLHDLENDPAGVREAVSHYTAVLAATCQQAVGFEMTLVKTDDVAFDNVIVDEAARANPLDLLIPMARARRRIILVGDHRQLPHILEPDIERQLEGSVADATRAALRQSLFERLFTEMRAREAADGVKRTVTLDVQYRMHPALASFVSSTFYEAHGEGFSSERPAEDFAHDLPGYEGRIAAWVELPLSRGRETQGWSKRRTVEARWIANEVRRLAEARPDLSIGVISFYAAQVDEIHRGLEPLGLSERLDDGSYRVADAWRETRGVEGLMERLRVGTVDAFQGKEFDVVILSMTRANDIDPAGERARRKKWGHLMLENRLCVAMSRQQRLLIVVGDPAMVRGEAASEAVPGIVAFREFCEGEHGVCVQG